MQQCLISFFTAFLVCFFGVSLLMTTLLIVLLVMPIALIALLIVLTPWMNQQHSVGAGGELPAIEPGLDAGDNSKPPAKGSITFCC